MSFNVTICIVFTEKKKKISNYLKPINDRRRGFRAYTIPIRKSVLNKFKKIWDSSVKLFYENN